MDLWEIVSWVEHLAWFIAAGFFGLQFGIRRIRPPKELVKDPQDLERWRSFGLRFASIQALVPSLCGIFQLLGGYDSFYYVFVENDHLDPFILLPRIVIFGSLLSFLGWILFAGGAATLVTYKFTVILRRAWMVKTFYLLFIPSLICFLALAMFRDTYS